MGYIPSYDHAVYHAKSGKSGNLYSVYPLQYYRRVGRGICAHGAGERNKGIKDFVPPCAEKHTSPDYHSDRHESGYAGLWFVYHLKVCLDGRESAPLQWRRSGNGIIRLSWRMSCFPDSSLLLETLRRICSMHLQIQG